MATKATPNIKAYGIEGLSYCDPEVAGQSYVVIDTETPVEDNKLVLATTNEGAVIRRFKDLKKPYKVVGVVKSSMGHLTRL